MRRTVVDVTPSGRAVFACVAVILAIASACGKSPTAPPQNSAPTVTVSFQGASTCIPRPGAPCSLEVVAQAADPDGDTLQYAWSGCATGTASRATCAVSGVGQVVASVTVTDGHGHTVAASANGQGTESPNVPPVVAVVFEGASSCAPEGSRACSLTVVAQSSDPDGDPLTYAWSGCASGTSPRSVCTVTRGGPVTAMVEVRDDHDHAVTASATGEGKENSPPVVTIAFQGASTCTPQIGKPCTLDVVAQASDPDGDTLRYAWSGCASGGSSRATCSVERPGPVAATVEVTDDHGHNVRADLAGAGGGSNRPPSLQIGYITLLPNSNSYELLGNAGDPDEPNGCGFKGCVGITAAGACRAGYLSCTCLAGLEAEVTRTATSGMCTVTFTLKDSWGETATPTVTFDVANPKPWVIKP